MPHLLADYLSAYDRDQELLIAIRSVAFRGLGAPSEDPTGRDRVGVGREAGLALTSRVESVSIERAVASLKRTRELAGLSLAQVAESAGLDRDSLDRLEGGDYHRTTLGTLRRYVLAMEPEWGWTLVESGEGASTGPPEADERLERTSIGAQRMIVYGRGASGRSRVGRTLEFPIRAGMATGDIPVSPGLLAGRPWVTVERGMTVWGVHRIRRREPEAEFDKPSPWTYKEEWHAGV
jgi:transcriptional regulator with XRE-family HTH domain